MVRERLNNRNSKIVGEKWKKYSIDLPSDTNYRLERIKESSQNRDGRGYSYHNLFWAALQTAYCLDADTYRDLIRMMDVQLEKYKKALLQCTEENGFWKEKLLTRIEQLEDLKFIYKISLSAALPDPGAEKNDK